MAYLPEGKNVYGETCHGRSGSLCSSVRVEKQELLYEIKEQEKQVEDTVFDRDEYNDLMKILKAREQQVAKL